MIEHKPQPGRQTSFHSSPADIVIYGGSAGGGKTWSLLAEPLRHVHNPDFGAVIFRRTYKEISEEGGMWDESYDLYLDVEGARAKRARFQWEFLGGSKISFRHMQHDNSHKLYKGAQIALIEFDQLEEFTASQFFYMLSRNRSLCGVRPYIRASANPEPGWLADFLDWWIDGDGYANLERAGKIRWFVRKDTDIIWSSDRRELVVKYPGLIPKSVTFIPATIWDNEILMQKDPGYLSNLQALPYVERKRLLGDRERGGNWKIKEEAGNLYNRDWFEIVGGAPRGGVECWFWDFAATSRKFAKEEPDYTARVGVRKVGDYYYVTGMYAAQIGPATIDREFKEQSFDGLARCRATNTRYMVRWEEEPGSASKRESRRLVSMLRGIASRGVRPQGDKVYRQKPWSALAEQGFIKVVAGPWNEAFLDHMHHQPVPFWPFDDIADAFAGAMDGTTSDRRMKGGKIDFYEDRPSAPVEIDERSPTEVDDLMAEADRIAELGESI